MNERQLCPLCNGQGHVSKPQWDEKFNVVAKGASR